MLNVVCENMETGIGRHKYLTIIELIAIGDWIKMCLAL